MPSFYDQLLTELRSAEQHHPAPSFDASDIAAGQRQFKKSLSAIGRGLSRIVPREPPRPPVPTPAETMRKAFEAFKAGRLSGDELRRLEAQRNGMVDTLSARGGK